MAEVKLPVCYEYNFKPEIKVLFSCKKRISESPNLINILHVLFLKFGDICYASQNSLSASAYPKCSY